MVNTLNALSHLILTNLRIAILNDLHFPDERLSKKVSITQPVSGTFELRVIGLWSKLSF